MKLSVNREQIIKGLQKAAAIIPAKAGAAYLRSIWLKAEENTISIMATDANIEFTGTYPAEVATPGLAGVLGRAFVDLVRQLPSGVLNLSLDEKGANLVLSQGRRTYRLPVNGPEWFQNFSPFPTDDAVAWSGDYLQDLLDRVTFCICDDDATEAMACLYLKPKGSGRIDICGLNGHQFAMVSFVHDQLCARLPESGVLIQKKYLQDLKKWLGVDDIEFNLTDKRVYLRRMDGAETISLPRALHEYPDYSVFLSKLDSGADLLDISRKESMEALGRILVFNTETDRCVYFDLGEKELQLSARGADLGSANECLEADYRGSLKHIAFPTRNLMDIMSHFSSARVNMILTGPEGPCGVRGAEDIDYTVIIMPMKISESAYEAEKN